MREGGGCVGEKYLGVWVEVFAIGEDFNDREAVVGCCPVDWEALVIVA